MFLPKWHWGLEYFVTICNFTWKFARPLSSKVINSISTKFFNIFLHFASGGMLKPLLLFQMWHGPVRCRTEGAHVLHDYAPSATLGRTIIKVVGVGDFQLAWICFSPINCAWLFPCRLYCLLWEDSAESSSDKNVQKGSYFAEQHGRDCLYAATIFQIVFNTPQNIPTSIKIRTKKEHLPNFPTPKKSRNRKFQPPKNPSIISTTWNPEYSPLPWESECLEKDPNMQTQFSFLGCV